MNGPRTRDEARKNPSPDHTTRDSSTTRHGLTPVEMFTRALRASGSRPRGKNWNCPAHNDLRPSLSVETGDDGRALVHCHAGCSVNDVVAALHLEMSDLMLGSGQTELFAASRYSPVGLDIMRKVPPGAERTLWAASALGRFLPLSGGRERVTSQRAIAAVILEAKHRRAVERELGISQSQLSNDIARWKQWGVAHGCSRKVLTIFVREETACPMCRTSLADDERPRSTSSPDDQPAPLRSLPDDVSVPESAVTDAGFFKGVEDEPTNLEEYRASSGKGKHFGAKPRPADPLVVYDAEQAKAYLRRDTERGTWPPWDRP